MLRSDPWWASPKPNSATPTEPEEHKAANQAVVGTSLRAAPHRRRSTGKRIEKTDAGWYSENQTR